MEVKDRSKRIQANGWVQARQGESHRQIKHPARPGTITASGKPDIDVPPGTLNDVLKQAGLTRQGVLMQFTVIAEEGSTSWGAYVPDLPGCVAAGGSREEALKLIREAIEFHLEGIEERGEPVPEPRSCGEVVEVRAA